MEHRWENRRKCNKSPDHVNYAKEFIFYLEVLELFSIKEYNAIHTVCGHCGYKRGIKEDGRQWWWRRWLRYWQKGWRKNGKKRIFREEETIGCGDRSKGQERRMCRNDLKVVPWAAWFTGLLFVRFHSLQRLSYWRNTMLRHQTSEHSSWIAYPRRHSCLTWRMGMIWLIPFPGFWKSPENLPSLASRWMVTVSPPSCGFLLCLCPLLIRT